MVFGDFDISTGEHPVLQTCITMIHEVVEQYA